MPNTPEELAALLRQLADRIDAGKEVSCPYSMDRIEAEEAGSPGDTHTRQRLTTWRVLTIEYPVSVSYSP
jgi:hypothetical protein